MLRRDPWVYIGFAAFFSLLFVALFGERIAPHEVIYFVPEHGRDPRPYDPGLVFPFGSDIFGRDLFSVVLAGARATLFIVVAGGLARVLAGIVVAAIGSWWRPTRAVTDAVAELLSAVPATLVALLIVKVFVKEDTSAAIFVGALLVTGWAGPYRIVRSELDRLAQMPFTQGASALGVGRLGIFIRHHVPHLAPLVAMNGAQQIIASLVLLAELGVLGAFVGATRAINIEESLSIVRAGPVNRGLISDLSEWGGLLANASTRSIESLWTTRWLFLVPGIAFAATAMAVAAIGFGIARAYARRNVWQDLRGRGALALALVTASVFLLAAAVPERYPAARDWADTARAAIRDGTDAERGFAAAGLRPVASTYGLERDTTEIVKTAPALVRVGETSVNEQADAGQVRAALFGDYGGGVVDAPVMFASRGVSPADYQPGLQTTFAPPDLGMTIAGYPDDYAGLDVRGKVVVLMRFMGVRSATRTTVGPDVDTAIRNATKRGAAAVLFVDPDLTRYVNVAASPFTPVSPYRRLELGDPIRSTTGTPVVILSPAAADRVLASTGLKLSTLSGWLEPGSEETKRSISRDLGVSAHVEVRLERASAHVKSVVAEVTNVPADAAHVLVWSVRTPGVSHSATDAAVALAGEMQSRRAPFIFVDFDPSVNPTTNARQVAEALATRRIALILILDRLDGPALRFTTPFGVLVPAIDLYAERAGAAHLTTRATQDPSTWSWPGVGAYPDKVAVLIEGNGGAGDRRADAAAVVAYLAGRYVLGAEELPR